MVQKHIVICCHLYLVWGLQRSFSKEIHSFYDCFIIDDKNVTFWGLVMCIIEWKWSNNNFVSYCTSQSTIFLIYCTTFRKCLEIQYSKPSPFTGIIFLKKLQMVKLQYMKLSPYGENGVWGSRNTKHGTLYI